VTDLPPPPGGACIAAGDGSFVPGDSLTALATCPCHYRR
jgi:hypothetical protein